MSLNKKVIALDCDGVLLDYNAGYAAKWEAVFGESLLLENPSAYHPNDRWGIKHVSASKMAYFQSCLDDSFWRSLPAIPGALDACNFLQRKEYELICVTAIENRFNSGRTENLKRLGFPISRVITTGDATKAVSPKAEVLNQIRPIAFVDDYAPFLVGVNRSIHRALVVRDPVGSPNVGKNLLLADSLHKNLASFARWWDAQS